MEQQAREQAFITALTTEHFVLQVDTQRHHRGGQLRSRGRVVRVADAAAGRSR
ncbi:MAG: hypothetical protein ACJ782_08020 [Actinomycetota bacterium]|jgi:hypothetical protein